jgi:hypothetical protein
MTAARPRPAASPRVLFICHNHPSFHPGGTEIFAHDLFRHMKDVDGIEAMFLACTNKVHREQKPGTNFQTIGRSADERIRVCGSPADPQAWLNGRGGIAARGWRADRRKEFSP